MYWLSISNLLEPALKPLMISLTVSFGGGLNNLDTSIRNNIECVAIWNKLDNFCQSE
jgi:hypothetical protein